MSSFAWIEFMGDRRTAEVGRRYQQRYGLAMSQGLVGSRVLKYHDTETLLRIPLNNGLKALNPTAVVIQQLSKSLRDDHPRSRSASPEIEFRDTPRTSAA